MAAWDRYPATAQAGTAWPRAGRLAAASARPDGSRPRFWYSLRVRILIPVIVATLGMVVLGATQLSDAVASSTAAGRSNRLAAACADVATLAHDLTREYVVTSETRRLDWLFEHATNTEDYNRYAIALGVAGDNLHAARARTDESLARFRTTAQDVLRATPAVGGLRTAAMDALEQLDDVRGIAMTSTGGDAEVQANFERMIGSLLDLGEALPSQMSSQRLVDLARSASLLSELHYVAGLQLNLISSALARPELGLDLITLAGWIGAEREMVEVLALLYPAGELYAGITVDPQVVHARDLRQVILDGRGSLESLASTNADAWYTAQSRRMESLRAAQQELSTLLAAEAADAAATARLHTAVVVTLAIGAAAVTLVGAVVSTVRLSQRLRRTRLAALTAARVELPNTIAAVTSAEGTEHVQEAITSSSQRIDAMLGLGRDEIGDLAASFGAVHRQALRLAADQAMLRMEVQAMFVALSRRGQTMVQRQVQMIRELCQNETNPQVLDRLYALDHLAARMRRNEENLLVLAGGEPGRWITRPVALDDLLRTAAQEIEDFHRVEIGEVPPVAVAANAAGDVIHLLAELMENAATYSPPQSKVQVTAGRAGARLTISIVDRGIGFTEPQLQEVNQRLAQPSGLTSALVSTMGLLVVARLAQRHGIQVRLDSYPAAGTTARVVLPDMLGIPLGMVDQLQSGQWTREGVPAAAQPASLPGGPAALPTLGQPPMSLPAPASASDGAASGAPRTGVATHPGRPGRYQIGSRESNGDRGDQNATPPVHRAPSTPDPEAVRARLANLARGIAAARRTRGVPPPPAAP